MPARNLLTLLSQPHLRARMLLMGDAKALTRAYFLSSAQRAGILAELSRAPSSAGHLAMALRIERPELLDALLRLGVFLMAARPSPPSPRNAFARAPVTR